MRPIATPLAASGFTPRALAFLERAVPAARPGPDGRRGGARSRSSSEEGDKPLVPGSPLSIAMVTGDFDLSGIGTVTHVEGDRVYGFGHPMFSLGACEFPMMTGYIHTVYPRASVSMKMGSPLKVVGVLDTDVSTGVAGRIGPKPDMLPLERPGQDRAATPTRTPTTSRWSASRTCSPTLVMAVLTNAIDTEGNLPEELTARIKATIQLKGHDPIEVNDTLSGPRYTGPMGPSAMFSPIASIVNILVRNPMAPGPDRVDRLRRRDLMPGRTVATIESVRLASDRLEPGQTLKAFVTLKPFKGERQTVDRRPAAARRPRPRALTRPTVCDMSEQPPPPVPQRAAPARAARPRRPPARRSASRRRRGGRRSTSTCPLPDRGLAVQGQPLPNLPGSARAVFATSRQTQEPPVRTDLIQAAETPWVVEGTQSLKFTVVKDAGLSLK